MAEGSNGNPETSKRQGNEEEKDPINEFLIFGVLFLDIIFLILVAEVLWIVTDYVLRNPAEVIEFSMKETGSRILEYLTHPFYGVSGLVSDAILHSLLFLGLLLALYSICNLPNFDKGWKKLFIFPLILLIDLASYYLLKTRLGVLEKTFFFFYGMVIISFCYQLGKLDFDNLKERAKGYLSKQKKIAGIALYIIFLHLFICFLFTELKEETGIFILFGVVLSISVGFFISFAVFYDITEENSKILKLVGIQTRNWADMVNDLKKNSESLLNHYFVAIFSYVFLRAFLEIILPENPTGLVASSLTSLKDNLSIILLIPLYVFFYKASSRILRSIYRRVYRYFFSPEKSSIPKERGDIIIDVLTKLTKIIIGILIFLSLIGRFKAISLSFASDSPLQYVIGTLILAPIIIWLIVLFLDPFFEGETIEVGSIKGKIKQADLFFTRMETMTGENVYVPNAELLTRTIKRLTARTKEQNEENTSHIENEKGIMIHFSCTLSYKYDPELIENIFKGIFEKISDLEEEAEREKIRKYLEGLGCDEIGKELDYIRNHPSAFVFIEEFKDHGIVYRFNFRVRDSLYAPIYRGYFMKRFKELMKKNESPIVTPSKLEVRGIGNKKEFEW